MKRREVLAWGASIGALSTLSGCAGQGTSQETKEDINSAADDLLKAEDEFMNQAESIDSILGETEFDESAVNEHIESAKTNLESAESSSLSDEMQEEVSSLQLFADYIETGTELANQIVAAGQSYQDGLDAYGNEEYANAISHFENASSIFPDATPKLSDLETTIEKIDEDDVSTLEIDLEQMEQNIEIFDESISGYEALVSGFIPLTEGVQTFEEGDDYFNQEEYSNAEQSFQTSSEYFNSAADLFDDHTASEIPDELPSYLDGLVSFSNGFNKLSVTFKHLSTVSSSFGVASSYLDSNRYADAIEKYEDIDSQISTARQSLTDGRESFQESDELNGDTFDEIEVESRRESFDSVETDLEALDYASTGLVNNSKGLQKMDEAISAGEEENYAMASQLMSDASLRFGDAEASFEEGEALASSDALPSYIDWVCEAGAYEEGCQLYSEAYSALDSGDLDEAEEKSNKGDEAFNQC